MYYKAYVIERELIQNKPELFDNELFKDMIERKLLR